MTIAHPPAPGRSNPTRWLDVPQLAAMLCMTDDFVRRLVQERRIPYYKIGKFVRFDLDDVLAWLDDKRHGPLR